MQISADMLSSNSLVLSLVASVRRILDRRKNYLLVQLELLWNKTSFDSSLAAPITPCSSLKSLPHRCVFSCMSSTLCGRSAYVGNKYSFSSAVLLDN